MKTKLQEAFELFTYKDSAWPLFRNPFQSNGKVYATDDIGLIFADKVDFEFSNEETPPVALKSIIPKVARLTQLPLKPEDFEPFRTVDETTEEECEECCEQFVKLGDAYFSVAVFYRLIQVREILGGSILLLNNNTPHGAHLFSIGECGVVLMPLRFPEGETALDFSNLI